jgi:uncharacterized glyoxalase superfamily protein PhnB
MPEAAGRKGANGKYTVNGTPVGYTAVTPFIVVDKPAEAIAFCEKVFGARVKNVTSFGSGEEAVIVHAELDFGNGRLQLGAPSPQYRTVLPPGDGNACYSLGVHVPDVDRVLELAVAHGATVREPAADFVSGDRYASILDPCGVRWTIMSRVEDLSEEESFHRVEEWSVSFGMAADQAGGAGRADGSGRSG